MRTCKIILLSLLIAIIMFFVSINYVFTIPFAKGSALLLVYGIGLLISIIFGLLAAIIFDKIIPKSNKVELEQKLHELKSMLDNRVITNEEYEEKRKDLINKY